MSISEATEKALGQCFNAGVNDDILSFIFESGPRVDSPSSHRPFVTLEWAVSVSQVSTRWRAISLSNSFLWSDISSKYRAWIPMQLSRTKDGPLSVSWTTQGALPGGLESESSLADLKRVLKELNRIRELRLQLLPTEYEQISGLTSQVAPSLIFQSISIAFDQESNLVQQNRTLTKETMPAHPLLRHLHIRDSFLWWPATLSQYHSLTDLSITYDYTDLAVLNDYGRHTRHTVPELLHLLAQLSKLERLQLSHAVNGVNLDYECARAKAFTPKEPPIALPFLKHIEILGLPNLYCAVEVSQHIIVDPDCKITYFLYNESIPTGTIVASLDEIVERILPIGTTRRQLDQFFISSNPDLHQIWAWGMATDPRAFPTLNASSLNDWDVDALFKLFLLDVPRRQWPSVCSKLWNLHDLSQLRALTFDTVSLDMSTGFKLFDSIPRLEVLSLGKVAGAHALKAFVSAHATQSAGSVPFPALNTLEIQFKLDSPDATALLNVLQTRKTFGCGLRELVHKNPNFDFSTCADELKLN